LKNLSFRGWLNVQLILKVSGLAEWVFQEDKIPRENQVTQFPQYPSYVFKFKFLKLGPFYCQSGRRGFIGWLHIPLFGRNRMGATFIQECHLLQKQNYAMSQIMYVTTFYNCLSHLNYVFLLKVIWSLLMWVSLIYSERKLFYPSSRRLANWCFFNWMVNYYSFLWLNCFYKDILKLQISYNLFVIAMFFGCDILFDKLFHYFCKDDEVNSKKGNTKFSFVT